MVLRFNKAPVPHKISGPFAAKSDPWTPASPHRGVDFRCPSGVPVITPAAGTSVPFTNNPVNFQGTWVPAFGHGVCLDHGEDAGVFRYTLYAHLQESKAPIGARLSAGEVLGISGASGYAFGAHLHWQLCKNTYFSTDIRDSADPMSYIQEVEDLTSNEVRDMIRDMQNRGELASTTDVLACISQIVGTEVLTYTDKERVEKVREALVDYGRQAIKEVSS